MSTDEDHFAVEDVSCGAQAHGFGRASDGRPFAFQVKRTVLRLEVYRADLLSQVPEPEDVVAVAELSVTDVDLEDERSVVALVRDAASVAVRDHPHPAQSTTIHSFLTRIGSIIDGI